jgi:hypothetical protein
MCSLEDEKGARARVEDLIPVEAHVLVTRALALVKGCSAQRQETKDLPYLPQLCDNLKR